MVQPITINTERIIAKDAEDELISTIRRMYGDTVHTIFIYGKKRCRMIISLDNTDTEITFTHDILLFYPKGYKYITMEDIRNFQKQQALNILSGEQYGY